jgi:hypothetical protein
MALARLSHDDSRYERWLADHPDGYVLNAHQHPTSRYVNAHRASCPHITQLPTGYTTWTAGSYLKVVADTIEEIDDWTRRHVGVPSARRCTCWR